MSAPQPPAPSGSSTLELVQNLALVLSASSQSRDEELGKVIGTFQTFFQEVKQDLVANAKEIAALKANVAALESEKKQLTLAMASEKQAFERLQSLVRSNETNTRSLAGTVNALQGTVNADHAFLYRHSHHKNTKRHSYTAGPTGN